jgi:hypothetical protein
MCLATSKRPAALFFVLAMLATLGCGPKDGLSDFERAQQKKDSAEEAIRKMGGEVTRGRYFQWEGIAIKLKGAQVTDDPVRCLKTLGRVAELDLSRSSITDDQLAKLNEQDVGTVILKLDLSQTAVTDAGLEKLTDLYVLQNLKLVGTKVTQAGAERFKQQRAANPKSRIKQTTVQLK